MKWFKHSCTARDDQKISKLMDELGLEGYGAYMIILEVVAHEMGPQNNCFAEFSLKKWGTFCQVSPKRFAKFAEIMANLLLFDADISEKNCKINIPNLLKYRDNHTKNLQVADKKVSLEKDKDKEKEQDKEKDNKSMAPKVAVDYSEDFETFWKLGIDCHRKNENKQKVFEKYRARRNSGIKVEDLLFVAERIFLNNQRVDSIEFRTGLFTSLGSDMAVKQILAGERFGDDALGIKKSKSLSNAEMTMQSTKNLMDKINNGESFF